MTNTKLIQNTKTIILPHFPELSVGKTKRVCTKHFTNLALWLPSSELELLSFLTYECLADNTFEYNTRLLERFSKAFIFANTTYTDDEYVSSRSQAHRRATMKSLIERGLILNTRDKKTFMINPMLTYNCDVVNNKKYKIVMEMYQTISPDKVQVFVDYYRNLVKSYLEPKKPNYEYGKNK